MPRTGSKSNSKKSPNITTAPSINSATANKELETIDQLFHTYANFSSGLIDPEGIELLCSHLEVPHTDVRMLMLAWKMQAEKQGYFTLEEWRKGATELKAYTMQKLKKALSRDLVEEVKYPPKSEEFFVYAFKYCLTENHKTLDIQSSCILLDLILGPKFQSQVASLIKYLETQKGYKVINMDQWMGFFRFLTEISFPDFSNYDPEHAWPTILDDFVDWMREEETKNIC